MIENERLKNNRDYFESGCLCIAEKRIAKLDAAVPNINAVAYYESACHCSRNYFKARNAAFKAQLSRATMKA